VTTRETLAVALQKHQAGQLDEAEQLYQQILQANPYHADALHLLGVLISQRGHNDLAVSYIERALIVKPHVAAFHNNLGFSFQVLGRLDEAATHFQEALRLQPDFAMAHNNMGKTYREQGNVAEAKACYEQALNLQADYVEAHFNRAELRLLLGDFKQGWPEYEWRWQLPAVVRRSTQPPLWNGSPLAGRTIVLHAEQGLGDTIQFARYAPLLKERGGNVIIHCQGSLLRLLASAPGIDGRVAWHTTLPPFDVQEHLLDLPGLLHTTLATIPAEIPYLHADAELVRYWRRELRKSPKSDVRCPISNASLPTSDIGHRTSDFLVGIAWKGSAKNLSDEKRSISLSCFADLARVEGVQLISLQKGPGTEQIEALAGRFPVLDLGSRLDEASGGFMDTRAVIMNLDLVISCDTAVPHLAGPLGVPVWVVLPVAADWRWLLEREDSPWYPTMRLFRQARHGQWEDVFERMAQELKCLIGKDRRQTASY